MSFKNLLKLVNTMCGEQKRDVLGTAFVSVLSVVYLPKFESPVIQSLKSTVDNT